jgi:tryptophanyl-tRNA synthetase
LHKIYCTPAEIDYVTQGCRTAGIGCLECKKIMIKHVIAELAPIREQRAALEQRPQDVEEVLAAGNRVAQEKAAETMNEVTAAIGL